MEIKESLWNLCLTEKNRYPQAQIQDYYKVVFQSIFGAGHLINDPVSAFHYLKDEWDLVEGDKSLAWTTDITLNIPIVRLNLGRCKAEDVTIQDISQAFLEGCGTFSNPLQVNFVDIVVQLAEILFSNPFGFMKEEITKILPLHQKSNYPIMHHSQTYKYLYSPHYRVIPRDNLKQEWSDIFL
jgi:hypothetical protein